jgi:uncharacterized membrane protein
MQNREHPGSITLDYADPRGHEDNSDDVSAMTAERRLATARPRARGNRDERHEALACGLGWFSIGLGVTELLAPRAIARAIGLQDDHQLLIRAFGLREITSGVGILSNRRPAGWVWSRVAGDAMDLACLGAAMASPEAKRDRTAAAFIAVMGVTLLDWWASQNLSRMVGWTSESGAILVKKSVTIDRSAEELYAFWRDFQNLSRFMAQVKSVEVSDDRHSHWTVQGPTGGQVEWDAEITDDMPNRHIAWRTTEQAALDHRGSVEFVPATGQRGTIVKVVMEYDTPAGMVGSAVAKVLGREPGQMVQSDLRRFKQIMEAGEVLLSDGSIPGIGLMEQRAAQPIGIH